MRELDEFDVLGLDRDKTVREEDIQQAVSQNLPVTLTPDSTIMLVQSGTLYPDGPMVAELSKHFRVVPFTGLATEKKPGTVPESAPEYSRTLRLAAARAGAKTVMCYWGILESGSEKFVTKTVSWLPLMNWVVPDERQHMRIRIKIALLDVPTGSWSVYSSEPLESKSWSVRSRREVADQKQVESIKKKAYELAAQGLVTTYARPL